MQEIEVEETLAMLQLRIHQPKLTRLVLSECSVGVQSIVQQPIVLEKLSKLTVGKSKGGRFKSQRLLFWERLGKPINRALESVL